MSQIVLKIPSSGSKFVEGECTLAGYEGLLLCGSVNYDITIESEINSNGERTIHAPSLSVISIERDVDIATSELTRFALAHHVSQTPWMVFFLKSANQGLSSANAPPTGGFTDTSQLGAARHFCYMTLKLHMPLVTKQEISAGEDGLRETLEISAASLEWDYTVTAEDNRRLGRVGFKFDMQTGRVG